jgi:hypothetical protein
LSPLYHHHILHIPSVTCWPTTNFFFFYSTIHGLHVRHRGEHLHSLSSESVVSPSSFPRKTRVDGSSSRNTIALFTHRLACPLSRNTLRVSVSAFDVQYRSSSPPLGACKLPHTLKQCEIEHLALTSYRRYQPTPESESRSGIWRRRACAISPPRLQKEKTRMGSVELSTNKMNPANGIVELTL